MNRSLAQPDLTYVCGIRTFTVMTDAATVQ